MGRDQEGNRAEYLGDGAYASFDGDSVHVYTSDGRSIQNRVVLGIDELRALHRFLGSLGLLKLLTVKL